MAWQRSSLHARDADAVVDIAIVASAISIIAMVALFGAGSGILSSNKDGTRNLLFKDLELLSVRFSPCIRYSDFY